MNKIDELLSIARDTNGRLATLDGIADTNKKGIETLHSRFSH